MCVQYIYKMFTLLLFVILSFHVSFAENWAVIVSTSRYWFNYRHDANSLSIYAVLRELGIPDRNIILMNAVNVLCDNRNSIQGEMYNSNDMKHNLCHAGIETDYMGDEVNLNNFRNLLIGRYDHDTPQNKRLNSDNSSNIFIYMSGHGGDEFLKFHDEEELSAYEISLILKEMHIKRRYKEILFIVDTCQASTLGNYITDDINIDNEVHIGLPGITFVGSSGKNENSYGYNINSLLGLALVDRFTFGVFEYFRTKIDLFQNLNTIQHTTDRDIDVTHVGVDIFDINNIDSDSETYSIPEYSIEKHMKAMNQSKKINLNPNLKPNSNPAVSTSILKKLKKYSVQNLLDSMDSRYLYSNIYVKQTSNTRELYRIPLFDFFTV